ncbi:hypothetical protein BKA93DRAFT_732421 [Sparassis latifolia]|uniref:Homeobox-domain-containing protein n=1 Tax=Sparassis crispa TaxID=139825 RepID=A0A401G5V2_9APHY|nr:homeobox-domain-containing protein [Sparassis crispa]GBE77533.1 homeobox-domain-containing protein [Sparassis crispa]
MHSTIPPWARTPPSPPQQHDNSTPERMENTKKPRHRHTPFQLARLNELFERTEHPSLEERTNLAEQLGMETKTVNSWFQNKRASSKKRHKLPSVAGQCELPPISTLLASVSPSAPLRPPSEYDELSEDEHSSRATHFSTSDHNQQQHTLFYTDNPQQKHLFESDNTMPRKARSRPSHAQTDELRKVYDVNQHPSKEEREELGRKIGMRYQSVTNWFQNQRSIAKKRKEEEETQAALAAGAISSKGRTYTSFPPAAGAAHPSLAVPPSSGHPSLPPLTVPHVPRARRSVSAAPAASRPTSPRASPYRAAADRVLVATHLRPRRTRPEPHQLEALKKLFRRTETPSIEERGALALEIGMEVGKVTNWFRNLRQTARRRAQKGGSGEEDDDFEMDMDMELDNVSLATYNDSRSVSRSATPSQLATSSATSLDVPMDLEDVRVKVEQADKHRRIYAHVLHAHSNSDMGSEEEYQEAVTPESSPPPSAYPPSAPRIRELQIAVDALAYAETEKASTRLDTGVKVEDALLLLSFHQHVALSR